MRTPTGRGAAQAARELAVRSAGGLSPRIWWSGGRAGIGPRELFHRPARGTVRHLFRPNGNPAHPEASVAYMLSLRQQALASASFAALAREHSESETRARRSRLGVATRGNLAVALEAVVFALAEGEVSAHLASADGAFLFRVTDVPEERLLADHRQPACRDG